MRIRTIKPEFFTHEVLFDAERETHLPIRVAFAGLWSAADRSGRFKWEPRRLGISILPYDGVDFSRVLDALLTRGFIVKYRVADEWFGAIPTWEKHQIINNREKASVLPDVSVAEEVDASSTREARVRHAASVEGKGKEGEGKGPTKPVGLGGQQELLADPPDSGDTRHYEISSKWGALFEGAFNAKYTFTGKDAAALKRFLSASREPAEEFLTVAVKAWERTKQDRYAKRCKEAATIHGLCVFFNDIQVELQAGGGSDGAVLGKRSSFA